jgi:hypothetical protein
MNENITINLDKFKPLFKEVLKLNYELGFNLFYNSESMSFEISKGVSGYVTIPYDNVIAIHTHPSVLYDSYYKPPTHTDYIQSIYDSFKSNPVNIVVEENGIWIYGPNKHLIEEVISIQPNIVDLLEGEMVEGEVEKELNVGDRLYELIDILGHNANNEHQNLILDKNLVIKIIKSFRSDVPEDFLNSKDIEYLLRKFRINKRKITLEEYINQLSHLASEDLDIGYKVRYIPWSEPFNISIDLTPQHLVIFNNIKERGLNVFDENDIDAIRLIADATDNNRILRK